MNLKQKLVRNNKIIIFCIINFIVLFPIFLISFSNPQESKNGFFATLILGTLSSQFFSYVYFPLICFGTLFIFPKLSLYQLQNRNKTKKLLHSVLKSTLQIIKIIFISSIFAGITSLLLLGFKIHLNLLNELFGFLLYFLMQSWIFLVIYNIGLIKQICKLKTNIMIYTLLFIAANIYLIELQNSVYLISVPNIYFAFSGISTLIPKINFFNLLIQMGELLIFMLITRELSKWILEIIDY